MAVTVGAVALAASGVEASAPGKKRKWGMAIDLDRCTACQACVVACRVENNVPVAGPSEIPADRGIFWMDMLAIQEGEHPEVRTQYIPTPCNHCDNAPCVKVCPVGATFQNEEGIVAQIWGRCIGCRYCTTACPYSRRYFNWTTPTFAESMKAQLNPDVATRPRGVVEKCTLCHQRIRGVKDKARNEGREIEDADVVHLTACSQACPAEAITFGDMADNDSTVSELARSPRAFRLLEELGTHPKVVYLREAKWKE
ncbi:MAG: 4Fe-4S dicluster domain-containing protein [Planctomycetes bacterium]|nr:4Fe-4S dicluster domain-containing protein [Planctomycetota bacterium]